MGFVLACLCIFLILLLVVCVCALCCVHKWYRRDLLYKSLVKGELVFTKSQVTRIVENEVGRRVDELALHQAHRNLPPLPKTPPKEVQFRKRPAKQTLTVTHSNPVYQVPQDLQPCSSGASGGARPKVYQPEEIEMEDVHYDNISTAGLKRRPTEEEMDFGYTQDWVVESHRHVRWLNNCREKAKEMDKERMKRNEREAENPGVLNTVWSILSEAVSE